MPEKYELHSTLEQTVYLNSIIIVLNNSQHFSLGLKIYFKEICKNVFYYYIYWFRRALPNCVRPAASLNQRLMVIDNA